MNRGAAMGSWSTWWDACQVDRHIRSADRSGRNPSQRPPVATRHRPFDVQEDPMHADLYLTIYRQQERELEQRLLHRFAALDRSPVNRARAGHHFRVAHLRLDRKAAHS